ncbi:MAG: hypothetical protein GMKNLPBB_00422 [Myxococcota bacterium]|nr:hypothetical protein [Myxococcota bacterium]
MSAATEQSLPRPDMEFFEQRFLPAARLLMGWHRFSMIGWEKAPREGGMLVLSTHSMATYEMILGIARFYEHTGRLCRTVADRILFQNEPFRTFFTNIGSVNASPGMARTLIEEGWPVGAAPGGMREALRPSSQRHQLCWEGRSGFAKLALEAQAPVILIATPSADDIYTVYDNALTRNLYRRFHVPLPLFRGLGLTALPRPVKLTTWVDGPVIPPKPAGAAPAPEEIEDFRLLLVQRMQALIQSAVKAEGLQ